jgi:GNAT superfamily N-acetyltransferase
MFAIRQATVDDLELLLRLRIEFLREVNGAEADKVLPQLRENLREYFLRHLPTGEFIAWLAVADGEVIGTSGLVFFRRPPSVTNLTGVEAYIMNMYTLSQWRGRGVATSLFQQVLDFVKTTPSHRVFLHATNEGRRIYEKFGFTGDGERMELIL